MVIEPIYLLYATGIFAAAAIGCLIAYKIRQKNAKTEPELKASIPEEIPQKAPPEWLKRKFTDPTKTNEPLVPDVTEDPGIESLQSEPQPMGFNFKESLQKTIIQQIRDKDLLIEMEPIDDARKGGLDLDLGQKYSIKFRSKQIQPEATPQPEPMVEAPDPDEIPKSENNGKEEQTE